MMQSGKQKSKGVVGKKRTRPEGVVSFESQSPGAGKKTKRVLKAETKGRFIRNPKGGS